MSVRNKTSNEPTWSYKLRNKVLELKNEQLEWYNFRLRSDFLKKENKVPILNNRQGAEYE